MSYLSHLKSHSTACTTQLTLIQRQSPLILLTGRLPEQIITVQVNSHQTTHYSPDLWKPGFSERCQNQGSQHWSTETKSAPTRTLAQRCGLAAVGIMSVVLAGCTSSLTSGSCGEAAPFPSGWKCFCENRMKSGDSGVRQGEGRGRYSVAVKP